MEDLCRLVAGRDVRVPVLGGDRRPYVNFDNAASTPPFFRVLRTLDAFLPWYGNVHRGTGFKSQLSTWALDEARRQGRVRRGDLVELIAFGAGLTWGAAVIQW